MKKVLVVNLNFAIDKTAALDEFTEGRVYRLDGVRTMPGGKGVNVARALTTLGVPVKLLGFVSGHNGRWIAEALSAEGLAADCIPFCPGESRVCLSVVDRHGVSTDLNEEGPAVPRMAASKFLERYRAALSSCDMVAFCGRIAKGLPDDFFCRLIALSRAAGKMSAVDTSGVPLRRVMLRSSPDLIKMNREEFEYSWGKTFTPAELVRLFRRMQRRGTQYVLVTDGPYATYAATPQNLWKFLPPDIKVVSPVGAGDSFMAGLIGGQAHGAPRQACVRMALGCAASDCLSLGAGIITKKQCEFYGRRAQLQRLVLSFAKQPRRAES
ncbi:MAG: 1-phosphofructokinase family hexose kinase [Elusimicrobia bacterium]|nr:1-phosphofructokinase family hexose kinase [Elusimicrobiota bacterium]